jgi:hypothetical protein
MGTMRTAMAEQTTIVRVGRLGKGWVLDRLIGHLASAFFKHPGVAALAGRSTLASMLS